MWYGIEVFWSGVPQSWAFSYQIEQREINLYLGDGGQKKYIVINLLCPTACHCGYRHSVDLLGKGGMEVFTVLTRAGVISEPGVST